MGSPMRRLPTRILEITTGVLVGCIGGLFLERVQAMAVTKEKEID
jgi:uncharacterized protein YneF (UPF0154 family)